MVSTVARNRFFSLEKCNFCCNEVGSLFMASTKVSICSHGLAVSLKRTQYVLLVEGRVLRELTFSGSVKKGSFFKNKFVLYFTKILLILGSDLRPGLWILRDNRASTITFGDTEDKGIHAISTKRSLLL